MKDYELTAIDAALVEKLKNKSEDDAPWAHFSARDWDFLAAGVAAGLDWRVHEDFLAAYLKPTSKTDQKRQENARQILRHFHEAKSAFPSGIGLRNEHQGGYWRGNEDDDQETTREFVRASEAVPGTDFQMARLMEIFWPDAPVLVWNQVRDRLVQREQEEREAFYGGKSEFFIDTMDFGRAVRFLTHVDRLVPQPKVNWEYIINPPVKSSIEPAGTGPRARRKA